MAGRAPTRLPGRLHLMLAPTAAAAPTLPRGHVKAVLAADFSPSGYLVATGGEDNTARIFDLRKKGVLQILPGAAAGGAVAVLGGRWGRGACCGAVPPAPALGFPGSLGLLTACMFCTQLAELRLLH